jgi:hypothetical protein
MAGLGCDLASYPMDKFLDPDLAIPTGTHQMRRPFAIIGIGFF